MNKMFDISTYISFDMIFLVKGLIVNFTISIGYR